jgi:hypothetical protein
MGALSLNPTDSCETGLFFMLLGATEMEVDRRCTPVVSATNYQLLGWEVLELRSQRVCLLRQAMGYDTQQYLLPSERGK